MTLVGVRSALNLLYGKGSRTAYACRERQHINKILIFSAETIRMRTLGDVILVVTGIELGWWGQGGGCP